MEFIQAINNRRTRYALSNKSSMTDESIVELVKTALAAAPSAFNSQSSKAVLLLGENHAKLWDIVMSTLRARVAPEKFGRTEDKINSFAAGYGTILYFDDAAVTDNLKKAFAAYEKNFDPWAEQGSGMLQYVVWTALAEQGMGASVQHYNPIIDDEVKAAFDIPQSWRLIAQMPFGVPTAPAADKVVQDVNTRLIVKK